MFRKMVALPISLSSILPNKICIIESKSGQPFSIYKYLSKSSNEIQPLSSSADLLNSSQTDINQSSEALSEKKFKFVDCSVETMQAAARFFFFTNLISKNGKILGSKLSHLNKIEGN